MFLNPVPVNQLNISLYTLKFKWKFYFILVSRGDGEGCTSYLRMRK